jgi:hypothetical protein
MAGVRSIQRKLKAYKNALPDVLDDSVEATKGKVIELNKDQLLHGINASGNRIGIYKNDEYAVMKNQMNPLAGFGFKDYRLTGAYYAGIFATTDQGKLTIGTTDFKAAFLDRPGLYGLTVQSKISYRPFFRPVFFDRSRQVLKQS